MGEAKKREPGGKRFHMFKREQFLLVMHVLGNPSKDRDTRRKRKHMWDELSLNREVHQVVAVKGKDPNDETVVGVDPAEWADLSDPIPVRISGGTMDTMIAELAGQLQGPAEVVLGDLEDRLVALRDGNYNAPDGLWPEEPPANGKSAAPLPEAAVEKVPATDAPSPT